MSKNNSDNFLLWAVAGAIGVVVRDVINLLEVWLGFGKSYIWDIASDIFTHGPEVYTPLGHVVGIIADLTIGGMVGVALGLVITWTGTRFYLLKGVGIGLAAWLLFFGILQHNLPQTATTAPTDAVSNLGAFIGHLIFGVVAAWSYFKLAGAAGTAKEAKPKTEIVLARWYTAGRKRRVVPKTAFKPLKSFKPKD